MRFLRGVSGQGMIEWLTVTVILVAMVGAILLTLFATLSGKLKAVNDGL